MSCPGRSAVYLPNTGSLCWRSRQQLPFREKVPTGDTCMSTKRKAISESTKHAVLTEAGYRCAVPGCGQSILDLHHIVQVSEGGGCAASNLLPLCPTCHARHHRGEISKESIWIWKAKLVGRSFSAASMDEENLLFLDHVGNKELHCPFEALLAYKRLIIDGFVASQWVPRERLYRISLTQKGRMVLSCFHFAQVAHSGQLLATA